VNLKNTTKLGTDPFTALLFATDVYQQNHGTVNGEQGWRYSFTFMEAAPLAILMQALHLADNLNKWSVGAIMIAKAVLDGILFGLILLPIGFFWQFIVKDSPRNEN
jgi:hypothetical protein